jgi:hypothetical protein
MELLRWKTRLALLWLIHMAYYAAYLFLLAVDAIEARQGGATQVVTSTTRFGIAFLFFVPSLLAWLSLTLKDAACRWTNFVVGILFAILLIGTLCSAYARGASTALQFNIFTGCVVSLLTVWYAWKWPKQQA